MYHTIFVRPVAINFACPGLEHPSIPGRAKNGPQKWVPRGIIVVCHFLQSIGEHQFVAINKRLKVPGHNGYMFYYMGLSENSVPLHPMVVLIIIPTKWLFHWGYTPFSDIPIWDIHGYTIFLGTWRGFLVTIAIIENRLLLRDDGLRRFLLLCLMTEPCHDFVESIPIFCWTNHIVYHCWLDLPMGNMGTDISNSSKKN